MENRGSWEGHDEDATQDAAEGHHLPRDGAWDHVAVAHCGHGNDGPPKAGRDAAKTMALTLSQVYERGEQRDSHAHKKQQETKITHAFVHRQAERLQSQRVPRQAHDVQDAQGTHEPQNQTKLIQISSANARTIPHPQISLVHHQRDVVRQNGHGVDDVEWPTCKLELAMGLQEA